MQHKETVQKKFDSLLIGLVSPAIRVQPDLRDRIRSDLVSCTECSSVSKPISHRFDIHL